MTETKLGSLAEKPLLVSIAYRMLGSVLDAGDVVQEANLRWQGTEEQGRSPKAYPSTVVTRLSIDRLRSARVGLELGWIPSVLTYRDGTRISNASPRRGTRTRKVR